MRLLVVGGSDSPHVARWLRQVDTLGWDIHLFAAYEAAIHPDMRRMTVYSQLSSDDEIFRPSPSHASLRVSSVSDFDWQLPRSVAQARQLYRTIRDLPTPERHLADLVDRLRPDVVHSLETQQGGYLTLDARALAAEPFPPWIHSLWGSDIVWFGRWPEHEARTRAILSSVDVLLADCERDIRLGREWGFAGRQSAVVPGPGGYDLQHMRQLRSEGSPSRRATIVVKGYQGERGRALVALDALRRCADVLGGHEIVIYRTSADVERAALRLRRDKGLELTVLPLAPLDEIWRLMGRARVALGLSLSDGTPNTMLEAMVMGALPVQSHTEGLEEWIEDGRNGLLVPPEDVEAVAVALRRALSDDDLVDSADVVNRELTDERLAMDVVRPKVLRLYETAASGG